MDKESLDWLNIPPNLWHLMSGYRKICDFVRNIPVVNDAAERNIKLVQDFINSSTDEMLRQDLLIAIEAKRKSDQVLKKRKL